MQQRQKVWVDSHPCNPDWLYSRAWPGFAGCAASRICVLCAREMLMKSCCRCCVPGAAATHREVYSKFMYSIAMMRCTKSDVSHHLQVLQPEEWRRNTERGMPLQSRLASSQRRAAAGTVALRIGTSLYILPRTRAGKPRSLHSALQLAGARPCEPALDFLHVYQVAALL